MTLPNSPIEAVPHARVRAAVLTLAVLAGVALYVRWQWGDRLDPKSASEALRSLQAHWWARPGFVAAYVVGTAAMIPAVWRPGSPGGSPPARW